MHQKITQTDEKERRRADSQMTASNQIRFERPEGSQQAGFSLIELLVVVAIILIIAAIAIPNFLRSRMSANEASAAENVRTITTASVVYSTTWNNGYPPNLATLGGPAPPPSCNQAILIDDNLANAPSQQSGYTFAYTGMGGNVNPPVNCGAPGFVGYLVSATPIKVGMTGQRSFCSNEPGVIHYDITGSPITTQPGCEALPILQ